MLIQGTNYSDAIVGTADADTIYGGYGNDTINGQPGNDLIYGDDGNDVIEGNLGNDTIYGGNGSDTLTDASGNDYLDGGDGSDTFTVRSKTSNVTIIGGSGWDYLNISAKSSYIDSGVDGGSINVQGSYYDGSTKITIAGATSTILGGNSYDWIYTNDVFSSVIDSGDGNDSVNVYGANATVNAGAGDDSIYFADYYYYQNTTADDFISLSGGSGSDSVRVKGQYFSYYGRTFVSVDGGDGNDVLDVSPDNAGTNFNVAFATLVGGAGSDVLTVAGVLRATMTGGDGVDNFQIKAPEIFAITGGVRYFDTPSGTVAVTPGPVIITDFQAGAGGDVLDYMDVIVNATSGYDSSNPFGNGYLKLVQSGADTLLRFDKDGSANGASFTTIAVLKNVTATSLVANNFNPNFPPSGIEIENTAPVLTKPSPLTYNDTSGNDAFVGASGTFIATDAENNPLVFGIDGGLVNGGIVTRAGAYGTLSLNMVTGAWAFSPLDNAIEGLNEATFEEFTITVSDGLASDSQVLRINLNGVNDAPTGKVTVSGTAEVGQMLSASNTLADAEGMGAVSYQWLADDAEIDGATGSTLALTSALAGKAISVRADYTDGGGTGESVTSAATSPVENGNDFYGDPGGVVTNDTLTGNDNANGIFGLAGNDTLNGLGGNDTMEGGSGNDFAYGGDGNDSLVGGVGDDWLEGQNGNDTLDGGDGNDTLTGVAGNDVMQGGAGNDAFYSFAGQGPDTIDGGLGTDTLTISRSNLAIALTLNIANPDVLQTLADGTSIIGIEQINYRGSTGSDNVIGGGSNDTLIGNLGNDSLYGGWGLDSILGEAGNDLLNGGGQNDTLDGGGGNDTLDGGGGSDVMRGGTGNDSYMVDSALDVTDDTGGIDLVLTSVTYTIGATIENVTITSAASLARNATGNALANIITGSDGANVLSGLDGNDKLYGQAGADKLLGGNGDDTMSGGLGYDELTGGAGNDRFVFASDMEIGGGDTLLPSDLIRDFVQGQDRIDLSAIDAKAATALTNEAFSFIGAAAFTAAGQLRAYTNTTTNRTLIQGDLNGDKVADFQLQLVGLKTMAGADFVL